jgi:hypothetical protein
LTSASDVVIFTSPTQIASCASIAANIGSIVAGLLLVRHHRDKQNENPAGAVSNQLHPSMCQLRSYGRGRQHTSSRILTVSSVLNRWRLFSVFHGHCLCGRTSFLASHNSCL